MSDPTFTPVPLRARRDGWTPERQHAFIAALRESRCVTVAARAVGMTYQTAYRLHARPDAASFAAAWDAAVAGPDSARPVSGRAIDGVVTPVFYKGRQIGERRRYDDRLAQYLLAINLPDRYGTARVGRRAGDSFCGDVAGSFSPSTPLAAGISAPPAPSSPPASRR